MAGPVRETRTIAADGVELEGDLVVPDGARAVVVFAHGSGSSRHSPRNRSVAQALHAMSLATLLFDLLTPDEEREEARTGHHRFDIDLLARRLISATRWLDGQADAPPATGYFGASTGASAALVAASELGERIGAVVSRGGRPDLAGDALVNVSAPTLLIVGGNDHAVLEMNRVAYDRIHAEKQLRVVEGATHLFEEPGTLESVAQLAGDWFRRYLASTREEAP